MKIRESLDLGSAAAGRGGLGDIPGSSRRYSFKTLATMGISYFSSTFCVIPSPLLIAFRR